jgi:tRNA guanosine-2'-O-methyltransferase
LRLYDQQPLDAPAPCIPLGDAIARPELATKAPDEIAVGQKSSAALGPQTMNDVTTALQTKGTAYLARSLTTSTPTRANPNLIVVGSLVSNPFNLGGLSRISEIFGAAALTLQNQNVMSSKDFISVAVSSHLHFPIVQLSSDGVSAFLRERKNEGYAVVGIEQTDRSVILGSSNAVLPEKCVLVVGSEREGIPAEVLIECEILVEIPQVGVTRSLNVQTAVAIVLYEYARQYGAKEVA